VLSDEFFEFIPMSLFEVKGWGLSVGVANVSKLEIAIYGEVVGAQPGRVCHSHVGTK